VTYQLQLTGDFNIMNPTFHIFCVAAICSSVGSADEPSTFVWRLKPAAARTRSSTGGPASHTRSVQLSSYRFQDKVSASSKLLFSSSALRDKSDVMLDLAGCLRAFSIQTGC